MYATMLVLVEDEYREAPIVITLGTKDNDGCQIQRRVEWWVCRSAASLPRLPFVVIAAGARKWGAQCVA